MRCKVALMRRGPGASLESGIRQSQITCIRTIRFRPCGRETVHTAGLGLVRCEGGRRWSNSFVRWGEVLVVLFLCLVPVEELRDSRLLMSGLLGQFTLVRKLPFASSFALTAPLFRGGSRVLLHLPGSIPGQDGEGKHSELERSEDSLDHEDHCR
jgi:hypothetical protein